jgi:hypothetical protein
MRRHSHIRRAMTCLKWTARVLKPIASHIAVQLVIAYFDWSC